MSGSNLRPVIRKSQKNKAPADRRVTQVVQELVRQGLVLTQGSFNRLSRWLGRLAAGNELDLRTPFFALRNKNAKGIESRPRDEIVAMFDSTINSASRREPVLCEHVLELEKEHRGQIGVMSAFQPWRVDGDTKVKAVFSDKMPNRKWDKLAWERALERLRADVPGRSIKLTSIEEAIAGANSGLDGGMDTTTNSGTPFWISPWKVNDTLEGDRLEEVAHAYKWIRERTKTMFQYLNHQRRINELPLWFATAGQRLVQKGPDVLNPKRKRIIEAYPKEEAILCKTFTVGAMNALRLLKSAGGVLVHAAWQDLPTVDSQMQLMLRNAHKDALIVNSGDISNFDATIPPQVLWDVGRAMSEWLSDGSHLAVNLTGMMVYKTSLITPSGIVKAGPSSMKSGSGLTNYIGTNANKAMQYYGEELGLYKILDLSVLGDDFVISGKGVSPEATAECFSHFGMEAHPDKQYYRQDSLQFLKRLHVLGRPGGIASVYRTLGSVLSLEKLAVSPKDWNKFAYVVQALSRLQNAAFNPFFKDLVTFVKSGDKLSLGSNMTPDEVVTGAGNTGTKILAQDARATWKNLGEKMPFNKWLVNGVLRGESLPVGGRELFRRVYGVDMQ